MAAAWVAGSSSLYFSAKLRGWVPAYRARRRWGGVGSVITHCRRAESGVFPGELAAFTKSMTGEYLQFEEHFFKLQVLALP
jgi:hypothetical protein